MITRRERAKTQARIDVVLADIRHLEARGLHWVGTPAPIAVAMPQTNALRPVPIEVGLVVRSKLDAMLRSEHTRASPATAICLGDRRNTRAASLSSPRRIRGTIDQASLP